MIYFRTVSSLRVIVGEHDSSESNVQNSVRETHNVDYVFMHEEYNYYSLFDADISLLKLSSSIGKMISIINPQSSEIFNNCFQSLDIVSRYRDPQHQVTGKVCDL